MYYDADVIVIGAGGGGMVMAKELGERKQGWQYGKTKDVISPLLRPQPNAILPQEQAVGTNPLRSTNISYLPLALTTGNVVLLTEILGQGKTGKLYAKAIVLAAGAIDLPRLWLNSRLPHNPWVGRGYGILRP